MSDLGLDKYSTDVVETLVADVIAILEKDDVEVNLADLEALVEEAGFAGEAHQLAFNYLCEVDGSYSEEDARAIAWF